ncbi:MAG: ribulose 1,5-bisphosphate carboxylase [Alphaproteobacteria bacterium]|nr:ribulose 1,5-bisphosphate carboxylase [Alphaproteobacteria bacterium]
MSRIHVTYRVKSEAGAIEARAEAIALEQSVELPREVIDDPVVKAEIIGRVEAIDARGDGFFAVRIGLAEATTGLEVGQLMNMAFGNTSIQDDVVLEDIELTPALIATFGGPRQGLEGFRRRTSAARRALTCSALKPQGLPADALAALAGQMARGGIDLIKDDHGLADQGFSPFDARARACAAAVREANRATGGRTVYLPSLSGNLDQLRRQVVILREIGLDTALVAPMVVGLPAFCALVRENADLAFMAHPAMAGAQRIAPPLLLGKLFRLFGADATIFPNHGGRFGYTPETCRAIAAAARHEWAGLRPSVPVPAGGMSLERVPEMLDFYGPDTILLIGGGLLAARERLSAETARFVKRVAEHVS